MIAPKSRPTKTPEGLDFPYSHFGDTGKRTELLENITSILGLNPRVVVNVGCGYDTTPSDAFPEARVVHIDREPNFVRFLSEAGFEAYTPDDVPDLEADLSISILGGDPLSVTLTPEAVILSTSRYLPEDMGAIALVSCTEPPEIVIEPDAMERLWYENEGHNVHLVAMKRISN